jgi:hypothetical protein
MSVRLQSGQWWHKPFGMVQTNLREIDASMDVDAVADWIRDFGATAWLIGVGGIQAQYPTDLPFQTRNPVLAERKSGDLVGDALKAAHSRGLRLLARMDFSKVAPQVAAEHPEWCYMSPNGNLQEHTAGLVSVCPCGGYYQERIFDILDEVTTRYKIDGMFFNWASMNEQDYYKRYHGVCHCINCQARWLEFSAGLELPKGPEDASYAQWLIFSQQILDGIISRIRSFMTERLPDAGIISRKTADIMFKESNNAIGRELWHHQTSEWVSSWIAYRPEVPVLVNATCFLDMPYRMAGEEPAHFAQYLIQAISRGGNPSTYMMGTPGKIPYPCLGIASEITRFHKKWSEVYDGIRPSAMTGLVRPYQGYMRNHDDYEQAVSEFRGLYSSMQELHVPFDVLAAEHLMGIQANGSIERYKVIILPHLGDLGRLPVKTVESFDSWVERGGSLIATGSSGVGEGGLVQFKSLPSERRLAAVTKPELLWSSYIAPPQKTHNGHYYDGPVVPLYGACYYFDWKHGSRSHYKMLARAPFAPPEKAYGNVEIDHPGYMVGRYGSGKGIVIPFTVGRGYREIGLSVFRDFFAKAWREGDAQEKFSFDMSEQVEVTVHQTRSKTVVHLVNMSGARRSNFASHLPIPGGSIKVSEGNVRAHALKADTELEVINGKIKLPVLGLYEVVVIDSLTETHVNAETSVNGLD